MNRRAHLWIGGRVQGVCYRAECAGAAHAANVKGWVRNLPDGRVEAVFEGEDADVEAMIAWCGRGPPAARVLSLDVKDEAPVGEAAFRVAR